MTGEHIIQKSTMLRSQGFFHEAILNIETNIGSIDKSMRETAWMEAKFAAEEINNLKKVNFFEQKAFVAKEVTKREKVAKFTQMMPKLGLIWSTRV